MQTVTLGASHLDVTPIACGTWQFGGGRGPVDEQAAVAAISGARSAGIDFSGAGGWRSHGPAFTGPGLQRNLIIVAALSCFAAGRGATIVQLAVAWVLAHPAVQVAIVGARIPAHLEESLGALDLTLGQGDLAEIATIMAAALALGGPTPQGTI